MIKCPKEYKIPTNAWLRPIKVLIDEYNLEHPTNLFYETELIENKIKREKILVKVSKVTTLLNTTEQIYNSIKQSPHIVKIYCYLHCNENKTYLDANYKEVLGFCNSSHTDTNSQLISLEIMEKNYSSLRRYESTLKLDPMLVYLKYILLIQLELFNNYGFTHNDMHLGNVLVKKTANHFIFPFGSKTIDIITDKTLVLTDFEESIIISKKNRRVMLESNKCKYGRSLESNVYNTFAMCIELLKDENAKYGLSRKLKLNMNDKDSSTELLIAFCTESIDISRYKQLINKLVIDMIELLFKELFNIDLF